MYLISSNKDGVYGILDTNTDDVEYVDYDEVKKRIKEGVVIKGASYDQARDFVTINTYEYIKKAVKSKSVGNIDIKLSNDNLISIGSKKIISSQTIRLSDICSVIKFNSFKDFYFKNRDDRIEFVFDDKIQKIEKHALGNIKCYYNGELINGVYINVKEVTRKDLVKPIYDSFSMENFTLVGNKLLMNPGKDRFIIDDTTRYKEYALNDLFGVKNMNYPEDKADEFIRQTFTEEDIARESKSWLKYVKVLLMNKNPSFNSADTECIKYYIKYFARDEKKSLERAFELYKKRCVG
jgi:hypothetical protein